MSDLELYAAALGIEDYLQEMRVFLNGINPEKTAHSDSYMTIVDFDNLDNAMNEFADSGHTRESLDYAIEYWMDNSNMQPPLKLIARVWKRRLENTTTETE